MSKGVPIFAQIGNTNLTIAAWRGKWENHARLAMPDAADADAWARVLDDVSAGAPISSLATVTSRPTSACTDALERAARERGAETARLGREIPLKMRCTYKDPKQLGMDRRLAAWSAARLAGKPCIVLDAGTYLTCDAVDARGVHLPVAIAPGLPIVLHGAGETAQHLTRYLHNAGWMPNIVRGVGTRSTQDGITAGMCAFMGGTGQALIRMAREALGYVEAEIVFTGGDAPWLLAAHPGSVLALPHLCLDGLRLLYDASRND
ncbi:MAG: type III pantothenate kinase [Armatimonadetes bacterium]|nr:type III pantothenate kinase [Armatimonadota bacterium]